MVHKMSEAAEACVIDCTECHNVCTETLAHCLRMGGEHVAAPHLTLLLDCAAICHTAANFMLRGSDFDSRVCEACADVCDRCADDCARFEDDEEMQMCADTCRRCAESCREMVIAARRAA
jgi:hypothetical protein